MDVPIIIQVFIGLGVLYTIVYNTRKTNNAVAAINTAASNVAATVQGQNQLGPQIAENTDLTRQLLDRDAKRDEFNQLLVQRLWARIDTQEAAQRDLQVQVTSLQGKLADREKADVERTRQIEELVTDAQRATQERIAAAGQLNTFKKLVDKQQEDIDRQQKDLEIVQEDLSAAKAKVKETEEKLSKAQAELDQARADLADAQKRLTTLESQHTEDVAEKQRLTAELAEKDKQITDLKARVKELEEELAVLRAKVNTAPPDPPKAGTP